MAELIDQYNRRIRKLRVSLTDKCNLRCHYCMPIDSQFMDNSKYLEPSTYKEIIKELSMDYGLEEIRFTGGEPLLRRGLKEIISSTKGLSLKKIGLTTNAILLDKFLDFLFENDVLHLNISLDSLDQQNFKNITNGDHLQKVLQNIDLCIAKGFNVKINMVVMKGVNDHEINDFIEYSATKAIEVRFLEVMRIGYACNKQEDQFVSAKEIIDKMKTQYDFVTDSRELDSTSFNYRLSNGANIGFIASESQPFCGHCSRWRLSADGNLLACLLKSDGVSVKGTNREQREEIYRSLLGMKPYLRPKEVKHIMNSIGG